MKNQNNSVPDNASISFDLQPTDNSRLANLCGQFNEHLHQIESHYSVDISCRSNHFQISGDRKDTPLAKKAVENMYMVTDQEELTPSVVQLLLQETVVNEVKQDNHNNTVSLHMKKGVIKGRGQNQVQYLDNIANFDLTIGVGPAGTGKTYLAVASAVDALVTDRVQRLVLVRPAVEAGERLGFLPGDVAQKIDPYLRPIYDALYEMLGMQKVARLIEKNIIEIAPLAYMRGRTLNDAFIILDEAQNTTIEQMKMFLTRIGFGSTAVVTGDITQVDLPRDKKSGLRHALSILNTIDSIAITRFDVDDVVRHPLVKKIVDAYEEHED